MKDKIYIKDWQLFKPENFSSNTDLYYLKVANKVYNNLNTEPTLILTGKKN